MPGMKARVVVLGIGNELLGDDGVGVHAVRLLAQRRPGSLEVFEIGTSLFDAASALKDACRAVVIDAMEGGGAPGTIYKCLLNQCPPNPATASVHGLDMRAVALYAGLEKTPEVTVVGVEPAFIGWSMELSKPVREALPRLIEEVVKEAEAGLPE